MMNKELSQQVEKLTLELRRGVIVLAVLSQLGEEQYGYSLIRRLEEKGLEVEQGTLYPLLRRLEANGLLQSEWRVDGSRPRRYYRLSPDGETVLKALGNEWTRLAQVMEVML